MSQHFEFDLFDTFNVSFSEGSGLSFIHTGIINSDLFSSWDTDRFWGPIHTILVFINDESVTGEVTSSAESDEFTISVGIGTLVKVTRSIINIGVWVIVNGRSISTSVNVFGDTRSIIFSGFWVIVFGFWVSTSPNGSRVRPVANTSGDFVSVPSKVFNIGQVISKTEVIFIKGISFSTDELIDSVFWGFIISIVDAFSRRDSVFEHISWVTSNTIEFSVSLALGTGWVTGGTLSINRFIINIVEWATGSDWSHWDIVVHTAITTLDNVFRVFWDFTIWVISVRTFITGVFILTGFAHTFKLVTAKFASFFDVVEDVSFETFIIGTGGSFEVWIF